MIFEEKYELIRKLARNFAETELTSDILDQVEETAVFPQEIRSFPVARKVPFDQLSLLPAAMEECRRALGNSGRTIVRFQWKGTDFPVESWADMYQRIIRELHNENPSLLIQLARSADSSDMLVSSLRTTPPDTRGWVEITPGLWLHTGMGTHRKITRLRRFFELFGADPADLVFFLKEPKADAVEPA